MWFLKTVTKMEIKVVVHINEKYEEEILIYIPLFSITTFLCLDVEKA